MTGPEYSGGWPDLLEDEISGEVNTGKDQILRSYYCPFRDVTIVGVGEGDSTRRLVGADAPLIQAIMGLSEGDETEFGSGSALRCVEIVEILPPSYRYSSLIAHPAHFRDRQSNKWIVYPVQSKSRRVVARDRASTQDN